MKHLTPWGWYWLSILVLIVAPEIYWVIVNSANTISDTIWAVEGLNLSHPFDIADWTPLHFTIAFTLWILFGWLSIHLPFGLLS